MGKQADITVIDFQKPHLTPCYSAPWMLSFYANGNDVDTVIVDGEILLQGGKHTNVDVDKVIEEARKVVGDGRTYISFDVDGLDPVYAPGTGTPEVGGITTLEAQQLLRGLKGLNLIGGDVVEVAPPFDNTGNTALVGATMMFEILSLIADTNFG